MEEYAPTLDSGSTETIEPVIDDTPIIDNYKFTKSIATNPTIFNFTTDLIYQFIRQFWWISIFMITTLTIEHYIPTYQNKMMVYILLAMSSLIAIFLPNKLDIAKL